MSAPIIPYRVDTMTVDDLDRVTDIEAIAHSAPWPASAYRHELEQNHLAHYLVLLAESPLEQTPLSLRQRLLAWLRRPRRGRPILGYGGFWLMVGEAHVSTLAIDPEWRGLGLGELLLLELMERALALESEMITLEVRLSNVTAQNLYEKYGFEYVGRRKRYYRDNNEDAHIMTVENVQEPAFRAFLDEQWERLRQRFARQEGSATPRRDRSPPTLG